MTFKIMFVLAAGITAGIFLQEGGLYYYTDFLLDGGLCLLLLFVGMDIGNNREAGAHIRKIGSEILLVPVAAAAGSITGGIAAAFIMGMNIFEGAAVGGGFGWYSLSAILIAPYSAELSSVAFLTNIFREVLAIILIPFAAGHISHLSAIGLGGATSMDTTLPIISRNTNEETAVIAFISGLIMSALVPVVVPVFAALIN